MIVPYGISVPVEWIEWGASAKKQPHPAFNLGTEEAALRWLGFSIMSGRKKYFQPLMIINPPQRQPVKHPQKRKSGCQLNTRSCWETCLDIFANVPKQMILYSYNHHKSSHSSTTIFCAASTTVCAVSSTVTTASVLATSFAASRTIVATRVIRGILFVWSAR